MKFSQTKKVDFLKGITDITLALYSSSWGRLQCTAETYKGDKYYSWTGRPEQDITRQMIIDAIDSIDEQIKKEAKNV
jgi:hypothetical protein